MSIKIGLDAGHGLRTSGKQTPNGIKEWTINDKVRDKIVAILKDYDVEIIHTDNDEGNTDESLSSRLSKYLNAGVKAFVSIHHNACTGSWGGFTGVEVYTDKNPTTADQRLADCIYGRLVNYTGLKGRGIKAEDWYVINQDRIPAVLVEGGFMDGTSDYNVITSDSGQTAYAKAVAEGLIEFLGLQKKNVASTPTPSVKPQPTPAPTPTPSVPQNVEITYVVKIEGGRVLPEVKNLSDYAGIENKKITDVAIKVNKGSIKYQVHVLGGGWLPWVTGYNWNDHNNGYAGNGKPIDAIRVYYNTPSDLVKNGGYREAKYRVSRIGSTGYYDWQLDDVVNKSKGMDGYAGAFGKAIDKFQICIE